MSYGEIFSNSRKLRLVVPLACVSHCYRSTHQLPSLMPSGRVPTREFPHRIFLGVQSNYGAIDNVYILFKYPSMISNQNNLEIETKKIGLKNGKNARGTPSLFFNF